jgi:hypothetical protein
MPSRIRSWWSEFDPVAAAGTVLQSLFLVAFLAALVYTGYRIYTDKIAPAPGQSPASAAPDPGQCLGDMILTDRIALMAASFLQQDMVTDGTMQPDEVVLQAAWILRDHELQLAIRTQYGIYSADVCLQNERPYFSNITFIPGEANQRDQVPARPQ